MKKRIGVTAGTTMQENGYIMQTVNTFYLHALELANAIPVVLSYGTAISDYVQMLDGLLLTGGEDINPQEYGMACTYSRGISVERDQFELALCRAFVAAGKPVLGICRGHQVVCVAMGGTLYQDIGKELGLVHPSGVDHAIALSADGFLADFLIDGDCVNSTHHQAVRSMPQGFRAIAHAKGGIVEAMQAVDGRKIFSVQFHPEKLVDADARMIHIFRKLTEDDV